MKKLLIIFCIIIAIGCEDKIDGIEKLRVDCWNSRCCCPDVNSIPKTVVTEDNQYIYYYHRLHADTTGVGVCEACGGKYRIW